MRWSGKVKNVFIYIQIGSDVHIIQINTFVGVYYLSSIKLCTTSSVHEQRREARPFSFQFKEFVFHSDVPMAQTVHEY